VARAREALAVGRPVAPRADAVHAAAGPRWPPPDRVGAERRRTWVTTLIVEPAERAAAGAGASLDDASASRTGCGRRTAVIAFTAGAGVCAGDPVSRRAQLWPQLIGFFGAIAGMAVCRSCRTGAGVGGVGGAAGDVRHGGDGVADRGRLVLTPVVIGGIALGLTATGPLIGRPWIVIAWVVASLVAPIALEARGCITRT